MSEQAAGTATGTEQSQQGTQTQTQHATQQQATAQGQQQAGAQQATQSGQQTTQQQTGTPTLEQLQQQLEQERQARQQYEDRYKHLQGAYTQTRQQLSAIAGNQPQDDPLKPYVDQLVKLGYSEGDARAVAGVSYQMIQPLQQQLMASQAALQNQTMVDDVLRSAYQQDQVTLSDPEVWQAVEAHIRQEAMNAAQAGQPWDPQYAQQYALNVAWQTAGQLRMQRATRGQQTPPQQQPQVPPFIRGFSGIPGNFTPAPAQQQQQTINRTPEQQQLSNLLAQRMGKTQQ